MYACIPPERVFQGPAQVTVLPQRTDGRVRENKIVEQGHFSLFNHHSDMAQIVGGGIASLPHGPLGRVRGTDLERIGGLAQTLFEPGQSTPGHLFFHGCPMLNLTAGFRQWFLTAQIEVANKSRRSCALLIKRHILKISTIGQESAACIAGAEIDGNSASEFLQSSDLNWYPIDAIKRGGFHSEFKILNPRLQGLQIGMKLDAAGLTANKFQRQKRTQLNAGRLIASRQAKHR